MSTLRHSHVKMVIYSETESFEICKESFESIIILVKYYKMSTHSSFFVNNLLNKNNIGISTRTFGTYT